MHIVFVIDLKILMQVELEQYTNLFEVAAVNYLSTSTLVVLVNKIGML